MYARFELVLLDTASPGASISFRRPVRLRYRDAWSLAPEAEMSAIYPHIRYATTGDNVRLAFWTLGSGYPVIHLPSPQASHLQKQWSSPDLSAWFQGIARDFTLIRYDGRGLGLSDHDVSDLSLHAAVGDLDAIVSE